LKVPPVYNIEKKSVPLSSKLAISKPFYLPCSPDPLNPSRAYQYISEDLAYSFITSREFHFPNLQKFAVK
jgi:hypothetical protein